MMYRFYLLLYVMSAGVFGDSREAKYIDLLPEEEKQEFLNRIARRIIEEIQSKDSPEQSHVEVSDDQLNAHHAYVKDLIKEESENMRNERRYNTQDNFDKNTNIDELNKDKVPKEYDDRENNEKSQHIDLTLRNDRKREKLEEKFTDDSTISVIPVKVLYDQDDIKISHISTNNSDLSNGLDINNSRVDIENATDVLANTTKENENDKKSQIENTQKAFKVSDDQSSLKINLIDNLTISQMSTEANLVIDLNKHDNNSDDSFESKKTSTNNYIDSDISLVSEGTTQRDFEFSTYSSLFTVKPNVKSASGSTEQTHMPLLTTFVTMDKNTTANPNVNSEIQHSNNVVQSVKSDIITLENNATGNDDKKYLRKRLETLSDEDTLEKEMSHKKNIKSKLFKNNRDKQYYVYEIPEDKPIFVQMPDSKDTQQQPYVVPVYNFAPENAYYNGYNHFGPNNDEEVKLMKFKTMNNKQGILDKELFLRSGFKIDLNPMNFNYVNDKKGKQLMDRRYHPHWANLYNTFFESNNAEYHRNNVTPKKRNRFGQVRRERLKYIPLRQDIESDLNGEGARRRRRKKKMKNARELPNSSEENHPYNSIHKFNDHIRAVKNLFYQQQHFGIIAALSNHNRLEPTHKRFFDGGLEMDYDSEFDTDDRKDNNKIKVQNIALDYYFGRYKSGNRTRDEDFDYEYPDFEDHKTDKDRKIKTSLDTLYKLNNRMVTDNNCDDRCIEMALDISENNFNKYLDVIIKVLKDMIYRDKKDLVSYNWLHSTVDMESAVMKLLDLTTKVEKGKRIHPLDLELLKYVMHLYNISKNTLKNTIHTKTQSNALHDIDYIVKSFLNLLRRRISLPKNKKKRPGEKIKNPITLWYRYYIREGSNNDESYTLTNDKNLITSFKTFLEDLKDNMFELHSALKQIASITKYGDQNWYMDLKNIYLKSASKKQLLRVVLHLAASRLFCSIEDSAEDAEKYERYVENNEEILKRIRHEFVFVLRILERMKKMT